MIPVIAVVSICVVIFWLNRDSIYSDRPRSDGLFGPDDLDDRGDQGDP
jgi:hypothetical protein